MTKHTKASLNKMTMKDLKKLCRESGIKGYSPFNKADLVKYMFKKLKKSATRKKSASKEGCHYPDGCETKTKSKGGYSAKEIRELAKECGIKIKGKNRADLCKEIAKALKKGKPPPPPPPPLSGSKPPSSKKPCTNTKGKAYKNKSSCERWGGLKGCVWDDEEGCYKPTTEEDVLLPLTPEKVDYVVPPPPRDDEDDEEGVLPPQEDEKPCNNSKGEAYKSKRSCERWGEAKGCVWDGDKCIKHFSRPPPLSGSKPPSSKKSCNNSKGKAYKSKRSCERWGAKGCVWDDEKGCHRPTVEEVDEDDEDVLPPSCYGGTMRDLLSKKDADLIKLLKAAGITKGIPRAKQDLVNYLCALGAKGDGPRCDPDEEKFCDGDFVCDAEAKLCLPSDYAEARGLEERVWDGRRVIGTKVALDKLWDKLDPTPTPGDDGEEEEEEEVDVVVEEEEEPPPAGKEEEEEEVDVVVEEEEEVVVEVPTPPTKPREGETVITIEEILRQLEKGSPVNVGEMSGVQREVLTCLGLLSSA